MKRVISIATACVMAVLVTMTISVTAQDFNWREKTFITFSGPVELPGLRLEGGTYVFQLADTPLRNIVQAQDEKDILGQWLFIQAERPEVSGETVVTFRETTAGATPAVQFWYYPGEKIGKEFVYPKDQAMRMAARTGATVQSVDGAITADAEIVPITAVRRARAAGFGSAGRADRAGGISVGQRGIQRAAGARTPAGWHQRPAGIDGCAGAAANRKPACAQRPSSPALADGSGRHPRISAVAQRAPGAILRRAVRSHWVSLHLSLFYRGRGWRVESGEDFC